MGIFKCNLMSQEVRVERYKYFAMFIYFQDGLICLVDEMNAWPCSGADVKCKTDSVLYTMKYCNKYYVQKVSALTKSKSDGVRKPLKKDKFGFIFRLFNLFCLFLFLFEVNHQFLNCHLNMFQVSVHLSDDSFASGGIFPRKTIA